MWNLGDSHYALAPDGRLLCTYKQNGIGRLAWLDPRGGPLVPIDSDYQAFGSLRVCGQRAVFIGGAPDSFTAVVALDLATGHSQRLKAASDVVLNPGDLSIPEALEYPSTQDRRAHAFYYAPRNAAVRAPAGERPPLIVMSHGGPTAATESTLKLAIQYWTSRGFAVMDVNYGGSTGYGRAYRDALRGQWGVVDVEDCVHGALYLADRCLVDRDRLAIRGGSAGGYTTLCALCFHSVFKAGASHYGVSDLEALAQDTHKFESRYLDSLVGPYPARRDLYVQRSPLHAAEQLNCPVIFFQGLDDRIVPPNQAEKMVAALQAKGIPVAYLTFAGEQHGFRSAATIKRVLDAELYFYARVFGFEPPVGVEPVRIEKL
jgi:dipeptidyl aminopeptidase/acylaminoacyl peptidase